MEITLDRLEGDVQLQPGEAYVVRAVVDGSDCVEASGSQETEVRLASSQPTEPVRLAFDQNTDALENGLAYCAATSAVQYVPLEELFVGAGLTFTTSVPDPRYDSEVARQCLSDYGGVLTLTICYDESSEFAKTVADLVERDLREISIRANPVGLDANTLRDEVQAGNCNIVINVAD